MKRILENGLFVFFLIVALIFSLNNVYQKIGYGYFKKVVSKTGVTFFTRDSKVTGSNTNSYKIENKDFNNAVFYKEISVKKNTPYRITCMIKTEGVEVQNKQYEDSGAKICILNTTEQSNVVKGTSDWQRATLDINSNQNEKISVGFMLGGNSYSSSVKGKAWFADLKIEEGTPDSQNDWNVACIILKNTNVNLFDVNFNYTMSEQDVEQITSCMELFKSSCKELSNDRMSVSYKIIEIEEELTDLSFDQDKGYYIDPKNVEKIINKYIRNEDYDHIFVCARLNDRESSIPIKNWIGLGSMRYNGIGFSNIRMPTDEKCYSYVYDEKHNTFPEEVFIHEFLHTLEQNAKAMGYEVPNLHDNEKYGYYKDSVCGLREWYRAYMTQSIGQEKLGLNEAVYNYKPLDDSNFKNSQVIDELGDVKNIYERINLVVKTMRCGTKCQSNV